MGHPSTDGDGGPDKAGEIRDAGGIDRRHGRHRDAGLTQEGTARGRTGKPGARGDTCKLGSARGAWKRRPPAGAHPNAEAMTPTRVGSEGGSMIRKRLPRPTSECTRTSPPALFIAPISTARPSPVPCADFLVVK